jgi:hypothetical protein
MKKQKPVTGYVILDDGTDLKMSVDCFSIYWHKKDIPRTVRGERIAKIQIKEIK